MSTLGLETVLIGNIVDGVGLTIITNILELASDGDGFIFAANVLQLTGFLVAGAIAGCVSVWQK